MECKLNTLTGCYSPMVLFIYTTIARQWIGYTYCKDAKYVLNSDDDMIVNPFILFRTKSERRTHYVPLVPNGSGESGLGTLQSYQRRIRHRFLPDILFWLGVHHDN